MKSLMRSATQTLGKAEIRRPVWTAEQLLASQLGCLPLDLHLENPKVLPEQAVWFRSDVAARANGVPLQYLLGSAAFYGREFSVGPGVFIPRPETEILIDVILNVVASLASGGAKQSLTDPPTVVDIGTGSGAIALTLALERPGLRLFGVDFSWQALTFARGNAARHQGSIGWIQGDLLRCLRPGSVDLLIANLPYLDPAQSPEWPRELAWEPWLALDGGKGGVERIEQLLEQAHSVVRPRGQVVLEIGMGQAETVAGFSSGKGFLVEKRISDLAGMDRVMVLRRVGS